MKRIYSPGPSYLSMTNMIPHLANLQLHGAPSLSTNQQDDIVSTNSVSTPTVSIAAAWYRYPNELLRFEGQIIEEPICTWSDLVYPGSKLHSGNADNVIENIKKHPLYNEFKEHFLQETYNSKMEFITKEIAYHCVPGMTNLVYRLALPSLTRDEFERFCSRNKGYCSQSRVYSLAFRNFAKAYRSREWIRLDFGSIARDNNTWCNLNSDEFGEYEFTKSRENAVDYFMAKIDVIRFFYCHETMAFEVTFSYLMYLLQPDGSWAPHI